MNSKLSSLAIHNVKSMSFLVPQPLRFELRMAKKSIRESMLRTFSDHQVLFNQFRQNWPKLFKNAIKRHFQKISFFWTIRGNFRILLRQNAFFINKIQFDGLILLKSYF